MKHYFLGLGAGMGAKQIWHHTFAIGREKDREELEKYLAKRYGGEAILTKNGRTGLAIALRAYLKPGDGVLVNGFTCYAVYEALEAAGVRPVWADISPRDLNFTVETLRAAWKREKKSVKAIIVQNTLGNPVKIERIERFARRHHLLIIEDLAHSTGIRYLDGREVGTVGVATVLSFGKDKAVDTTSGGAVILRGGNETTEVAEGRTEEAQMVVNRTGVKESRAEKNGAKRGRAREDRAEKAQMVEEARKMNVLRPEQEPKLSDRLRARFYPLLGAITRGLSHLHLSGVLMRMLLKMHWVERSADNRLDFRTKIAKFEAKLALEQLRKLHPRERKPLRTFCLVRERDEALAELKKRGYYFGGLWYEKPVAPERYYDEVAFPEENCPVTVKVAQAIINFPNYYKTDQLALARKTVEPFETYVKMSKREVIEEVKEVAVKTVRKEGERLVEELADRITEATFGEKQK